ncbi:MAG TPA: tetratricopeptide repeat protein [Bryobacteraceae bacterium]|nr:tetratricopeptide repeat protein [Bryobacteraceae bacterium]
MARNFSGLIQAILSPDSRPAGARLEDAYARLLAGRFSEATPLLETLYRQSNPHNDGEIRTLLAWTYIRTGRTDAARSLIGIYPIPLSSSDLMFASFIFPRYLFVRGAVLQQEGKRAEAKAAYDLFLKYSGDVPDVFGDEAAARKNLSGL